MTKRRERLLSTGLALTALVVWLQLFLPFVAPVDPRYPGRHILGDTAIICTVEGMKIVKVADLPTTDDGKAGMVAGAGSHACPLCAAHMLAAATLLPTAIEFPLPGSVVVGGLVVSSTQPRAPPPMAAFAARAPPSQA